MFHLISFALTAVLSIHMVSATHVVHLPWLEFHDFFPAIFQPDPVCPSMK